MNQFILLRYCGHMIEQWECINMFDSKEGAIKHMKLGLDEDWEDARGWKWESYATIENNKVIHSESKEVWSAYKIIEIELPTMEIENETSIQR